MLRCPSAVLHTAGLVEGEADVGQVLSDATSKFTSRKKSIQAVASFRSMASG
ncbi:hypothetical protein VPH41_11840 [Janthinobacterium sp. P210006]|nr:hypothetical protein [Janthinobacterium sp. P210006]